VDLFKSNLLGPELLLDAPPFHTIPPLSDNSSLLLEKANSRSPIADSDYQTVCRPAFPSSDQKFMLNIDLYLFRISQLSSSKQVAWRPTIGLVF